MPGRLLILGRGTTAEQLAELGSRLGYDELCVSDDLPDDVTVDDHVVVAEDREEEGRALLLAAAQGEILPDYLAYAGPRGAGTRALVSLAAQGVPKERIQVIASPAGVDVGAETPTEVAIAVAAELVAIRRGRARPSAGLTIRAGGRRARVRRPRGGERN